jgi:hypothetical protein
VENTYCVRYLGVNLDKSEQISNEKIEGVLDNAFKALYTIVHGEFVEDFEIIGHTISEIQGHLFVSYLIKS